LFVLCAALFVPVLLCLLLLLLLLLLSRTLTFLQMCSPRV
jgi:hypothetical protein